VHHLLAELFPYLVALYVVDGLVWVRGDQWLLVSWSGRRFRRRTAGIHLAGILPTAEALLTRRQDELHPLEPSTPAKWIAATAEDAGDVGALRALRARHLSLAPWIRALACLLFALTFAALPLTLFGPPACRRALGAVLAAMSAAYGALMGLAATALRRCGQDRRAIAAALLPAVMFPPAAVHALTLVGRDLYARYDPLALAAVLLDRAAFASLARREYHTIAAGRARSAGTPLAEWWALRQATWHSLLESLAVPRDEVLAAPPHTDAAAAAYGPACWTGYRIGFAECGDCGFPLQAFERA
jgi:hypothetical protein